MSNVLDREVNEYRFCMLGDLNICFRNKVRGNIAGAFGVPGEKENFKPCIPLC